MHGPYRILRGHHQLKADASGSWSGEFGDVNHWEGGAVPGSADDAVFPATSPSEFTLTVNAEYTVHKISFADSFAVDEGVEVSLTGGTFSWQHDLSDPRFYATDGADVDIGQKFVMVTNGPVTAKSAGALIARGFRNGTEPGCAIDGTFPRIVFTYPDGYFWVASGSYSKFYFNGPTTIGATCNMIVNLGHTMSHTYFKGDLTVDTLDYRDRTTRRTVCTRGLHPTDGEATLTVTGGGTYQLLQSQSYNSFKSVTVESGTTLTLLDRPASVAFGPVVAESFAMEANSALTLNAGANHVQAKTFAIDQSATITVTVPSAFAGAAPVLQTTDLTAPAVSLSQIVLAGSTEGVLLKNENGQVTVYKPGAVLTLDAGGRTATIDEDVAGEGTLVVTNGTLAVNSAAANDVTLKVAAGGALALPCDLNFGALEMQPGSSVAFVDGRTVSLSGPADLAGVAIEPPPGLRDRRGWQTVLVAGGGVSASGCKLPVGFELRTASAEGGVALQLRCVHGIMLIVK